MCHQRYVGKPEQGSGSNARSERKEVKQLRDLITYRGVTPQDVEALLKCGRREK